MRADRRAWKRRNKTELQRAFVWHTSHQSQPTSRLSTHEKLWLEEKKKDAVDSHGCEIGATDGKEKCVVIWLCLFVHSLVASPHYTFHSTTRRSFLIVIGARLRSLPILTRRRSEVKKNLCNALFSQSYVFFSSNFQVGCAAVERTVYSFFFSTFSFDFSRFRLKIADFRTADRCPPIVICASFFANF